MKNKSFDERFTKLINRQASACLEVCEKYGYPDHDEKLCLIVEDTIDSLRPALKAAYEALKSVDEDVPEYKDEHLRVKALAEIEKLLGEQPKKEQGE